MPTLEIQPTFNNPIAVALRWTICLLLLFAASVPVPVLAVPPEANDDEFTVLEDSDDSENPLDVLENDTPLPSRQFIIVGVTQGTHGSVNIIGGGTLVTYQPEPDFDGTDDFTYFVDDGSGKILRANVHIIVQGINDPPIARDDSAATDEDRSVVIDVLDNDTDIDGNLNPASVARISGPSQGRVTVDPSSGEITYRPNDDWHGQDAFTYRVCDDGSPRPPRCAQANVEITVRPVSDRPIADAGPDQTAPTLSTVTLDGSGSYDPDGEVELSYQWQQERPWNQQVVLSDPTAQSPTFVAPDDPEVLVFSLLVFDDQGQASVLTDTTRVTVTNQPPIADAGPDQRTPTESAVTLDGSASSDPDHDELQFEWIQTQGPAVSLSSTTAVQPTFTAPSTASKLTFELRVRDAFGARSAPDQVVIDVYEPPIFDLYLGLVTSDYALMPDLVIKSLTPTRNNVRVVIENRGDVAVTQGFYVDVYVNPLRAPARANEGWDTQGISRGRGLVWAIEIAQAARPSNGVIAPLLPGESLNLAFNDAFYQPDYSSMTWPLAVGTPIYAQVDTFPAPSANNGLVLETHEYYGQAYNNVIGPVSSTSAASSAVAPLARDNDGTPPASLPARP